MSSYVEPSFISFYADVVNCLFILLLLFYLIEKKIITPTVFWLLILSLFSCFLFNYIFFDWKFFPDQNKYFGISQKIRDQLMDFDIKSETGSSYQFVSGLFFSLVPLPFIETINSLSFFNKLIFVVFTAYFYHIKVIKNKYLILFIFFPSILLYSSLSLKDNVVYVLCLSTIYNIINGNNLRTILLLLLLTAVKLISGLLLTTFYIAYRFLFSIYRKNNFKKNYTFLILITLIMIFFLSDQILEPINHHMYNFYLEAKIQDSETSSLIYINSFFHLVYKLIVSSIGAFFNPVFDLNKNLILRLILVLENIIFIYVLLNLFKDYFKKIEDRFIFWFSYLLLNYGVFNLLFFNPGTIGRYKYTITFGFIFAILCEIRKKNSKSNN